SDADDAARLHTAGQPGTFLTNLGLEILMLFYQVLPDAGGSFGFAMIKDDAGKAIESADDALVAPTAEVCLGFVAATTSTARLFVELGTRRLGRFLPHLLNRYRQKPQLLIHSIQTIIYPFLAHGATGKQKSQTSPSKASAQRAELLAIMVEPERRGQGIGQQLLDQLFRACQERNISQLDVTVDAANHAARRFYERNGFVAAGSFTLYGRAMCHYCKEFATGVSTSVTARPRPSKAHESRS
ncbi:MAG: GNAT family N-acetyltransferase, partial [Caldilineaceae bacterium]|nr:GNAT family N-acetyltransferase [Caldilineaceae bacterium]